MSYRGFYGLNTVFEGLEFLGIRPATNVDVHVLVNGKARFNILVACFCPPLYWNQAAPSSLIARCGHIMVAIDAPKRG